VYLHAQELLPENEFQNYTTKEGLTQQVVRSISQDNYGFVWIGTENGLNRFDGYDFRNYYNDSDKENALPGNFIYALYPCSDGGMWIGTNNNGLAKYNPDTDDFESFDLRTDNGASNHRILSLYEDAYRNLWIGTYTGGLYFHTYGSNKIQKAITPSNSIELSSTTIVKIIGGNRNDLWLRSSKGLINYSLKNKEIKEYNFGSEIVNLDMKDALHYDGNYIWTCTSEGLVRFHMDTKKHELIKITSIKSNNLVYPVAIEAYDSNHLWLASNSGLILFNKENYSIKEYAKKSLHESNEEQQLFVSLWTDKTGSLWLGSPHSGLYKLNLKRKRFYHINDYFPDYPANNIIRALLIDSEDNLWIGALYNGIHKANFKNKTLRKIKPTTKGENGMNDAILTCFMERKNGDIWVGTWGHGIYILPQKSDKGAYNKRIKGNDNDNIIQSLIEDKYGNIWIGKETGLEIYNPGLDATRRIEHNTSDSNSITVLGVQSNCIQFDDYGNIWIGTWAGLNQMIPRTNNTNYFYEDFDFIRYQQTTAAGNAISDDRVISIHLNEIDKREIYVGTFGGGLNRLHYDSITNSITHIDKYTVSDGLPDNVIYCIEEDNQSNIWASTNKGLSMFNPKNETFKNYDVNDGLQDDQFFWGASYKSKEGELLFGGMRGFNLFDPLEIKDDTIPAEAVITDFSIMNQTIQVGDKINNKVILNKNINETDNIRLSYKEKIIAFEFSALHYAFPENNSFKYMLEGFDTEWIFVNGDKRYVSYTNLEPGDYKFRLTASNYDGIWSDNERAIEIVITPPLWKTKWFLISVITLILLSVSSIIRFRTVQVKRRNAVLRQLVKERTQELTRQKEQLQSFQ
jgi:ligand-binding sensor domain-containing protein